jgi:hypothetical protein
MNAYAQVQRMLQRLGLVRRSTSSWIGGFITGTSLGAIAGAALAAFLTPTNGKEMRRLVGKKAKQLAVRAERTQSEHPRDNGTREQHA